MRSMMGKEIASKHGDSVEMGMEEWLGKGVADGSISNDNLREI